MPAPPSRGLQSAGFILLVLAGCDLLVKLVEYLAGGMPLWQILLPVGGVLLLLDVILHDRTPVGENMRALAVWLGTGLGRAVRNLWTFLGGLWAGRQPAESGRREIIAAAARSPEDTPPVAGSPR